MDYPDLVIEIDSDDEKKEKKKEKEKIKQEPEEEEEIILRSPAINTWSESSIQVSSLIFITTYFSSTLNQLVRTSSNNQAKAILRFPKINSWDLGKLRLDLFSIRKYISLKNRWDDIEPIRGLTPAQTNTIDEYVDTLLYLYPQTVYSSFKKDIIKKVYATPVVSEKKINTDALRLGESLGVVLFNSDLWSMVVSMVNSDPMVQRIHLYNSWKLTLYSMYYYRIVGEVTKIVDHQNDPWLLQQYAFGWIILREFPRLRTVVKFFDDKLVNDVYDFTDYLGVGDVLRLNDPGPLERYLFSVIRILLDKPPLTQKKSSSPQLSSPLSRKLLHLSNLLRKKWPRGKKKKRLKAMTLQRKITSLLVDESWISKIDAPTITTVNESSISILRSHYWFWSRRLVRFGTNKNGFITGRGRILGPLPPLTYWELSVAMYLSLFFELIISSDQLTQEMTKQMHSPYVLWALPYFKKLLSKGRTTADGVHNILMHSSDLRDRLDRVFINPLIRLIDDDEMSSSKQKKQKKKTKNKDKKK